MRKVNVQIFDSATVLRDSYSRKYNAAKQKYDAEKKRIHENYVLDSEVFKQKTAKAKNNYDLELETIKNEALEFVQREIETVKQSLQKEVVAIPDEKQIRELSYLSNLPLSKAEIEMLSEKYQDNYWLERSLVEIAQKNNVSIDGLAPDVATQTAIIDELESNCLEFIEKYNGSDDVEYKVEALLSGTTLHGMEKKYTNAFASVDYTPSQLAQRTVHEILTYREQFEQGLAIKNALANCEDEYQRQLLMYELVTNKGIDKNALLVHGMNGDIEAFKNSEIMKNIENARKIMDSFKEKNMDSTEVDDLAKEIHTNGGYSDFLKNLAYENYGSKNEKLNEALELCQMAES